MIPVASSAQKQVKTFGLPIRRAPAAEVDAAAPQPGGTARKATPLVLVAEDNADSRDAMRTLLESLDYRVVEARDGEEAVSIAREKLPDLILMDMMMPLLDGFTATRELRADPRLASVPIIAITAMEGVYDRVAAAGCTDLYRKPIDVRRFLAALPGWLPR
jgi:CheY-like chemotaxis protein